MLKLVEYSLGGDGSVNGAVDERSQVLGGVGGLLLGLGDGELLEELVKRLDGLAVFRSGGGHVVNCGCHCGGEVRLKERRGD